MTTTKLKPPQALVSVTVRYAARFWQKVCVGMKDDACWKWTGCKDRKGYGQVWMNGRMHWAHRVAFCIVHGQIPEGMTVHHKCADPNCVNPAHLTLMTISENTAEGNTRRGTCE